MKSERHQASALPGSHTYAGPRENMNLTAAHEALVGCRHALLEFGSGVGNELFTVKSGNTVWEIHCEEGAACVDSLVTHIKDVCLASLMEGGNCDFLVVASAGEGQVWLVYCARSTEATRKILVRQRQKMSSIDLGFLFPEDEDATKSVDRSHRAFCAWLNDPALLTSPSWPADPARPGLLEIKVDRQELWFLRFPINLYVRLGLERFARFRNVQWVVTDRSLAENAVNRRDLALTLSSLTKCLEGTVVVINEYKHHLESDAELIRKGITLLEALLGQFKDVWIDGRQISLRCFKNPSAAELSRILLDPKTTLVFAAFEAGTGRWQLSDWQKKGEPEEFDIGSLKAKLRHIRLLRIFHCHSVFKPYEANARSHNEPAGSQTIARELLECGAHFVEGGITTESYFDFICSVIRHLFYTALRPVLDAQEIEGQISMQDLISRCNEFLAFRGFDEIR